MKGAARKFICFILITCVVVIPPSAKALDEGFIGCIVAPEEEDSPAYGSPYQRQGLTTCAPVSDVNGLINLDLNGAIDLPGDGSWRAARAIRRSIVECFNDREIFKAFGGTFIGAQQYTQAFCQCNAEATGINFHCRTRFKTKDPDAEPRIPVPRPITQTDIDLLSEAANNELCFSELYIHISQLGGHAQTVVNFDPVDETIEVRDPNNPNKPFKYDFELGETDLRTDNKWAKRVALNIVEFIGYTIKCVDNGEPNPANSEGELLID